MAPWPYWGHPSSDSGRASCPEELCSEEVSWELLGACFLSQMGVFHTLNVFNYLLEDFESS